MYSYYCPLLYGMRTAQLCHRPCSTKNKKRFSFSWISRGLYFYNYQSSPVITVKTWVATMCMLQICYNIFKNGNTISRHMLWWHESQHWTLYASVSMQVDFWGCSDDFEFSTKEQFSLIKQNAWWRFKVRANKRDSYQSRLIVGPTSLDSIIFHIVLSSNQTPKGSSFLYHYDPFHPSSNLTRRQLVLFWKQSCW